MSSRRDKLIVNTQEAPLYEMVCGKTGRLVARSEEYASHSGAVRAASALVKRHPGMDLYFDGKLVPVPAKTLPGKRSHRHISEDVLVLKQSAKEFYMNIVHSNKRVLLTSEPHRGKLVLTRYMKDFVKRHPEFKLDLSESDRPEERRPGLNPGQED